MVWWRSRNRRCGVRCRRARRGLGCTARRDRRRRRRKERRRFWLVRWNDWRRRFCGRRSLTNQWRHNWRWDRFWLRLLRRRGNGWRRFLRYRCFGLRGSGWWRGRRSRLRFAFFHTYYRLRFHGRHGRRNDRLNRLRYQCHDCRLLDWRCCRGGCRMRHFRVSGWH